MLSSSPICPRCCSTSATFEGLTEGALRWVCARCRATMVEARLPAPDHPHAGRLAISLGVLLAGCDQPAAAVEVYQAALEHERDPELRATLLSNCGGCLSALERPIEAEVCHRAAVATDPNHLGARWNLFANMVGAGRYADALEAIDQTIVLPFLEVEERENLEAYRAEMLIALGRYLDALVAIDRSLIGNPEELERLTTRARILLHLGRIEAARRVLGRIFAIEPGHPNARIVLERLERRAKSTPN